MQDAALKLDQKDYTGARASAEEALKENPEDVRALNVLVQSYAAQKQLPVGVQKVREYAQRQPASAPVQQFLGQLLTTTGDRVGARQAFEAAKAAKPGLLFADLALAEIDTNEGKGDEARKRLSAVVSSHPRNIPGRLLFAQLEVKEGKTAAAIEQYRKVLALDDKNIFALNGLAYLLAESGQPDEAIKYAQKAKEVAPDNAAVDDTLGWTYFRKGMYSLAVTHLESANAKEGTALRKYHLAMAYLKAGDPKRGRQTFEAATEDGSEASRGASGPPALRNRRRTKTMASHQSEEWRAGATVAGLATRPHGRVAAAVRAGCESRLHRFLTLLTLLFIQPLTRLMLYAAQSDLHSHILLVPFISGYLLYIQRGRLSAAYRSSIAGTVTLGGIGIAALAAGIGWRGSLSINDGLALMALAFVSFVAAGGFLFLGSKWMAAAAFPVAFLIFMVPLPDAAVNWLENASDARIR